MPLQPFVCEHCGFWQRHFAPAACPVCEDFRHPLPPDGWRFADAPAMTARVRCRVEHPLPGLVAVTADGAPGIGQSGYVLVTPHGNVAFEGAAWYDDDALDALAALGGVRST